MLRGLASRFTVVALPLLVVFVFVNIAFVARQEHAVLSSQLRTEAVSLCRNLAADCGPALESHDDARLGTVAATVARATCVAWVALGDARGHLLTSAGPQAGLAVREVWHGGAMSRRKAGVKPVQIGTDTYLAAWQTVASPRGTLGTVQLGLCTNALNSAASDARIDAVVLALLMGTGTLLITLPMVASTLRPTHDLVRTARALADGDLDARVPEHLGYRELDALGAALNRMAERVSTTLGAEHARRASLERRVGELSAASAQVAEGHLHVRAQVRDDDEMGRLAAGFNAMVDHLSRLVQAERATRTELEGNHRVLAAANRRLRELDRKKSEFLNTVSHELRTPLTSIKAFSEILRDQETEECDAEHGRHRDESGVDLEFLGIINQEADRLTRLIDDLLDLSRIEQAASRLSRASVDLGAVAAQCVRTCRALAEPKAIRLELQGTAPPVDGDHDRLAQVVTNLLSNAVKFTPREGTVTLQLHESNGRAGIAVKDTGVGIPERDLVRIFERFQQVDQKASSGAGGRGSGLGLTIVKSIVEAHGGTVEVSSVPGQGSTFQVWLPIPGPNPHAPASKAQVDEGVPVNGQTVPDLDQKSDIGYIPG